MDNALNEGLDLADPRWIDRPEELAERLLGMTGPKVTLDCRGLGAAPALLIQVLLSGSRSARARGGELVLSNPSDAFRDGLALLGLRAELLGDER